MADDELNTGAPDGTEVKETTPEPPPVEPPQPDPAEASASGRLKALHDDLRAAGITHDPTTHEIRQVNAPAYQPPYVPPVPEPPAPELQPDEAFFEDDTRDNMRTMIQREARKIANEIIQQEMGPIRPVIASAAETVLDRTVASLCPDAGDLLPDIVSAARELGYNTPQLIAGLAQHPEHVQMARLIALGKRAEKGGGAPPAPDVDDTRADDIAAVANLGGGGSGTVPKISDIDPELRREAKRMNISDDDLVRNIGGPTRIEIQGD